MDFYFSDDCIAQLVFQCPGAMENHRSTVFREKSVRHDTPYCVRKVSRDNVLVYGVTLIFPSAWKSPRIPPAYAKKTRIPILRTLEVRMPTFAYVRWFAYARRQEYQISVRTQKTCVRKDKNAAPCHMYVSTYCAIPLFCTPQISKPK